MSKKELLTMIDETKSDLAEAKANSEQKAKIIDDLFKKSAAHLNRIENRLTLIDNIVRKRCHG